MWYVDLGCDFAWVAARSGNLGNSRTSWQSRSRSLGITIHTHLYGDAMLRHVRFLMETGDREAAEACAGLNKQSWIAAVETAVILATGRPFSVPQPAGPDTILTSFGEGDEHTPALIVRPQYAEAPPIDFEELKCGIVAWNGAVTQHLFYFRRFVDAQLPPDVRWFNGYRLFEWHFVGDRTNLASSRAWRDFLVRFDAQLAPFRRVNQSNWGLMEETRAVAAHAGLDGRAQSKRLAVPSDVMRETFGILEKMVIAVINEHPERAGHPVQFIPR